MTVFLKPPLLFFVIAGLGCAVLAVAGLFEAVGKVRKAKAARASGQSDAPELGVRFFGNLAVTGILAFVAFYMLSAVFQLAPRMSRTMGLVGELLPEVRYARIDIDGTPEESLSEHRGDVILLNLWATWCPPCRKEMPALDRLHNAFAERGLEIVHLSTETPEVLREWLAENPMPTRHGQIDSYPVASPALPTTLVIDREGVVRDILVGGKSYGAFEKAVTPWL